MNVVSRAGGALVAVLFVSGVTTSCAAGDSPDQAASAEGKRSSAVATTTSYPLTIDNCGVQVPIKSAPRRVLLLNGSSVGEAESMVALGLTDRVFANAQKYGVSDDPAMVARVAALPTGNLKMNKNVDVAAEQVLAVKPDLVLSTWSGGFDAKMGFASREQLTTAGIASLVNPVNCAYGKADATAEEKATQQAMSIESSYAYLRLLGQVFDVSPRAEQVIADSKEKIAAVTAKVEAAEPTSVLVVFPGMAMMNSNGLPAVMSGGIYDDIITKAGGVNSFSGMTAEQTASINAEQLAAAKVDVLVIGAYTPDENTEKYAADLFKAYPQWAASTSKNYVSVSDSIYLGPLNHLAVEKIARAAHPDTF